MDLFIQHGLTEDDIKVYIGYLGMPQATVSQIMSLLEMEYDTVKGITDKLEEQKFIKKIEGIIERYVPLEPYFTLFTGQSKEFRDAISVIKDNVLADQSAKYDELDGIATDAKTEIENTVANQQGAFNSDANDQGTIATATITKARDRFEETSKKLELEVHQRMDRNYDEFKNDSNELESEIAAKWTAHSTKFTNDNVSLNDKLTGFRDTFKGDSDQLEQSLHQTLDNLNGQASAHTAKGKDDINRLIDDLLGDFGTRVKNLDTEIKTQMDAHVAQHKEHAEGLKPRLDAILQKYMDRMNDVVEDLKNRISNILATHCDHVKNTSETMQENHIKEVQDFEHKTKLLIDNLDDISTQLGDVSKFLGSRGSAFKALFIGQHNHWKEVYASVKERIITLGAEIKDQFDKETTEYVDTIRNTLNSENAQLKNESDSLDAHSKEVVNNELGGLATELSQESLDTMQSNIQHCADTSSKLKSSCENTINEHQGNFNTALNGHRDGVLNFNDEYRQKFDADVGTSKAGISEDITKKKQVADTFHADATGQHTEHASIFNSDTEEMKQKQNQIYKDRLGKILGDKDADKSKVSNLIDEQIGLFKSECKEMNSNLLAMLDDHKDRFKEVSGTLESSNKNTVDDTIQKIKDSIAEFSLAFMNKIDDAFELGEKNEEKLTEIHNAAHAVRPIDPIKTWHLIGKSALITYLKDVVWRTKSSIIIVTPEAVPEILELIANVAYERKAQKFFLTTHWDLATYGEIIKRMSDLGNVQFRQLKTASDYWAVTRDAEEIMIAPNAPKDSDLVCVVSEQDQYSKLYSQIIGPMFQAQSQPLKL